jgi:nucleoside-diphosphate-sugar epimerase
MEHMVRTWFDRLPIIIARPFNYTGPGQSERFLIPKIVGHFKRKEKKISLGNLDISRDFSDVQDVVESYKRLLISEIRSLTVNICSGNAIPLIEIIKIMNKISGYEIIVETDPEFVRLNEIKSLKGSNQLLKRLINFVPETSYEGILQRIYRY